MLAIDLCCNISSNWRNIILQLSAWLQSAAEISCDLVINALRIFNIWTCFKSLLCFNIYAIFNIMITLRLGYDIQTKFYSPTSQLEFCLKMRKGTNKNCQNLATWHEFSIIERCKDCFSPSVLDLQKASGSFTLCAKEQLDIRTRSLLGRHFGLWVGSWRFS